ncbi:hypothetical protein NDA11_000260 [Ustilago hordei]|uniref:Uncharacterized protein n=1 Tax=Ustilago hordei TaxID=120017 RepID=I2FTB0_USTHO|nr:uncharacterized protein UHO2_05970 [Ustilago hordei]KAJ1043780.1 hypothetical protein NDA10_007886 [Ustilago hordei]KAJ1572539.1 hypothetical protein NDA12_005306 [Ustilago hordei]KAJ1576265.1 hypothetical protein NDA15_007356 [Ustilago hordei]KAJ1593730.1 hypothetical protein NDA11_000260 [Ustilago hordei]KAJ1595438.1 hypothetical protein NDA14_005695 [Ustilago hordei]
MSFRYHKGPSIITLFHDPSSSTSKQILNLLSSYNKTNSRLSNRHHPSPSASAAPSSSGSAANNGESCVIEANGGGVGEYLGNAASDPPSNSVIQLEVVDRTANPPTPDQMRSIIDYLASGTTATTSTPSSAAGLNPTDTRIAQPDREKITNTAFNMEEHEKIKFPLPHHLATSSAPARKDSAMPEIKDGPIIVNWDQGTAATSLEGVKQMLVRIERSASEEKSGKSEGGGGCVVC